MIKIIKLKKGRQTIIDSKDWNKVKHLHWLYGIGNVYVGANIGGRKNHKQILLHRFIMDTPKGFHTDHINGDRLDNRRENLRICTPNQNQFNSRKWKKKSSKFKGVSWYKRDKCWRAYVNKNRQQFHLGYFQSEKDAGEAYNKKAKELFGKYACLNTF